MISSNAIASIEWLFENSLRDNVVRGAEDSCVVTFHADLPSVASKTPRRLFVLNISSYVFRIVTLFEIGTDAATVEQISKIMGSDDALKDQALLDAFGEFANRICGEVNRGLTRIFRHVGMSTPFILENSCLSYLSILGPSHVLTLKVVINDLVNFDVVVCICVDDETNLDFQVERAAQAEASSGELELF